MTPITTATNVPATATTAARGGRAESVVQVLILLAVAGMAGAASFTHVHDWTMHNSPAGTGDWFGWANAMVSELIPLAAGLELRRRRRLGQPAGRYPIALILGAVALSLSGQFAEAKPSPSGWLIAAVPALGFLALAKLVLSRPTVPASSPVAAAVPAGDADSSPVSPAAPVIVSDPRSPAGGDRPAVVPVQVMTRDDRQDEDDTTADERDEDDQAVTASLLDTARVVADQFRAAHGRDITRDQLRAALRVSNATASEVLRLLRTADRPGLVPVPAEAFTRVNGAPVAGQVPR